MSRNLKKYLMTSLEPGYTSMATIARGCNMIKPDSCDKFSRYCEKSNGDCIKKIGSPDKDDAFYDSIDIRDLNIPFVSPEHIFRFDKELSDIFLMEHAQMYVYNKKEYDSHMRHIIRFGGRTSSERYDRELQRLVQLYKPVEHINVPGRKEFEDRQIHDAAGACPTCGARKSSARSWRTNGAPPRSARHRDEDDEKDVNACVTCGAKATDARPEYATDKPVASSSIKAGAKKEQQSATRSKPINAPSWTTRFVEEMPVAPRSKPMNAPSWTTRFVEETPVAPSGANLVVSDLPKSNSGVAKTEQVMEQVMAANVSKGLLSRKKSLEVLASPAAQHYADLRVHLTQGEVVQLDKAMLSVHSGVEEILGKHLSTKDEKAALQALFDQYDLCQYVRTADKVRLTIPELTAVLTSFGEVDKRVRQATTRSTICYIILSVVLMDPKTFIEKLSGINKGAYSKK